MTIYTTTIQVLSFKTERDLILVNLLSALLILIIVFFPNSPVRIIIGLAFILFFPGYMVICALFPMKKDLDAVERLALSMVFSIAVTSLIGLMLNYIPFGIGLYSITISLFLFMLLMSVVAMYRRRTISPKDAFAPLSQMSISGRFESVKSELMKSSDENRIIKIVAIIAFTFIILLLIIIAKTPPASGYEISIYDAYPPYFWFFIITSLACGIGILLHQAFAKQKSDWWLMGLFIIILTNTIFLLLPEFRGYAFYGRGDIPSHLGFIRDILNSGHVGERNFYPIEHILGTNLIQVAGVSLEKIPSLFFVLFSGIYIANFYLLAKIVCRHSGQVLLIIAFASPLIYSFFHVNTHPSVFALFMIPCLLHFYHKRELLSANRLENTVVLLLMAFCITFFHPVTTLFVIIIFFTFGLAYVLYPYFITHGASELEQHGVASKNFFGVSLIMFITFFMWYSSFSSLGKFSKRVIDWLVYQIGPLSIYEVKIRGLEELEFTTFQTLVLFMNRYGAIFLLLLITSIAFIAVLRRSLSRKHNPEPIMFAYAIQFLIALFIGAIMVFGYFLEYNPVRVARFPLLLGTILSGLVVYDFINGYTKKNPDGRNKSHQTLCIIVTGIVIIAMVGLSLGSVYYSPRTCKPNSQVTQMDIVGTEWFERSKSSDIFVVVNTVKSLRRFEDYNFGIDSSSITRAKIVHERLPSHFGYDGNNSVAEALNFRDRYILIFAIDKVNQMIYPENVRPKIHQWTDDDFAKLKADPTVAQIYANGEFEVWRVYGK